MKNTKKIGFTEYNLDALKDMTEEQFLKLHPWAKLEDVKPYLKKVEKVKQ